MSLRHSNIYYGEAAQHKNLHVLLYVNSQLLRQLIYVLPLPQIFKLSPGETYYFFYKLQTC